MMQLTDPNSTYIKIFIQSDTQLQMAMIEEQRRATLNNINLLELEDREGKLIIDEIPEDYLKQVP